MKKLVTITSQDPILQSLNFRQYRSIVERRVQPFAPRADEKQTMDLITPWGETLTASAGDFIVSEIDAPNDQWPVRADIFEATYIITRPGYCTKLGAVHLVPMVDITDGDENARVVVHSLEGPATVRAGDFFLARGVKGEIWPYPKDKVDKVMAPVDE